MPASARYERKFSVAEGYEEYKQWRLQHILWINRYTNAWHEYVCRKNSSQLVRKGTAWELAKRKGLSIDTRKAVNLNWGACVAQPKPVVEVEYIYTSPVKEGHYTPRQPEAWPQNDPAHEQRGTWYRGQWYPNYASQPYVRKFSQTTYEETYRPYPDALDEAQATHYHRDLAAMRHRTERRDAADRAYVREFNLMVERPRSRTPSRVMSPHPLDTPQAPRIAHRQLPNIREPEEVDESEEPSRKRKREYAPSPSDHEVYHPRPLRPYQDPYLRSPPPSRRESPVKTRMRRV